MSHYCEKIELRRSTKISMNQSDQQMIESDSECLRFNSSSGTDVNHTELFVNSDTMVSTIP